MRGVAAESNQRREESGGVRKGETVSKEVDG